MGRIAHNSYAFDPGQRFSDWVVLSRAENVRSGGSGWLCKCTCGTTRVVSGTTLKSGESKSCGCRVARILCHKLPPGEAGLNVLFARYRHSAQKRGHIWSISKDVFRTLTQMNCTYCGVIPSQITHPSKAVRAETRIHGAYMHNGVDRVDSNMGYLPENVVACCKTCNMAKWTMGLSEFYDWIERIKTFVRSA